MSDDDRIWAEALAGKRTGDTEVEREALGLRRAMLERANDDAEIARRVADTTRVERLLERARREGVTRRRPPAGFGWLSGWPGVLAAAAACIVAIVIGFELEGRKPGGLDATVRGATPHVFVMTADDPAGLRDRIADELDAAGVSAHLYESLGRHGIDAELPDPPPQAVRAVLARHAVPLPADHVLRIEVVGSAP